MSKKENTNISFNVDRMDIMEVHMSNPEGHYQENTPFDFNLSMEQRFDFKDSCIHMLVHVIGKYVKTERELFSFKSAISFSVLDFKQYTDAKKEKHKFPNGFLITLNSIAISTTRGLMYSQFKGTYLQNAILPIVDPAAGFNEVENKK